MSCLPSPESRLTLVADPEWDLNRLHERAANAPRRFCTGFDYWHCRAWWSFGRIACGGIGHWVYRDPQGNAGRRLKTVTWVLILMPLVGLTLSVLVLYGFGLSGETESSSAPAGRVPGELLRLAPLARGARTSAGEIRRSQAEPNLGTGAPNSLVRLGCY